MAAGRHHLRPDGRAPLHPTELSEGAASLLPDVDRLAVLLTVAIDPKGEAVLRSAERAVVRSRAKLAYDTATDAELPDLMVEVAARVAAAEARRGAGRIEFPAPEIVADPSVPGGFTVRATPRAPSEDWNAALSLSANLAIAQRMLDAGVGLFRVMGDPPDDRLAMLRRTAKGLGVQWPEGEDLRRLTARLDPTDPSPGGLPPRRPPGRWRREPTPPVGAPGAPWHSVIAAPYAHATAPLRRLADRYVLDLVCELEAGAVSQSTADALDRLAEVMERAETKAAHVDRAAIDLVETVRPPRPRRRGVRGHRHRRDRRPRPHPAGRPTGAWLGAAGGCGARRGHHGPADRGRRRRPPAPVRADLIPPPTGIWTRLGWRGGPRGQAEADLADADAALAAEPE